MKSITAYQHVSRWARLIQVPGFAYTPCKFHPSCSEYARLAVERHGKVKGSLKTIWRVLRCNPFSAGGVDYP